MNVFHRNVSECRSFKSIAETVLKQEDFVVGGSCVIVQNNVKIMQQNKHNILHLIIKYVCTIKKEKIKRKVVTVRGFKSHVVDPFNFGASRYAFGKLILSIESSLF